MSENSQPAVARFDSEAFIQFYQEVKKKPDYQRFINNHDPFIAGPGLSKEEHDAMMERLLARIPQSVEETSATLQDIYNS